MPATDPQSRASPSRGVHTESEVNAPQVQIEYYTDPLCSWSWALEPQWRRLRYEFGQSIGWRYRMGGMIPDWSNFSDPINSVHSPAQLGPLWYQAAEVSGMPLDEKIWREDPPASSYPASVAFKAAEQQGPQAAEAYLRRLREAVMLERRNIARPDVLLAVAHDLASDGEPRLSFDKGQFEADLQSQQSLDAFRDDLKEGSYRNIGRFPTIVIRAPFGQNGLMVGYRPYSAMLEALRWLAPGMSPERTAADIVEYVGYWKRATVQEVAEALGLSHSAAREALDAEVERGGLARVTTSTGNQLPLYSVVRR